ncbi:MAG: response regulator [Cytophagales bacterium]|nr:MAG: response regulator [Cytophagales bacterium]
MNITIIDDDSISIFITKKILEKRIKKTETVSNNCGSDTLNPLKNMSQDDIPKLILLDINMPLMNGFEFLDVSYKLKSELKNKPIWIVSSSNSENDKIKAKNNPTIIDFITKPISLNHLESVNKKVNSN